MSFEPDDEATVLRQLREEIAKIREENFATALPTNNIGTSSPVSGRMGTPLPAIGITSIVPEVIFTTKDTGIIDLLNFDGKSPTKDFTIGETITGQNSGATAEVGDIDTLTDTTGVLTLVPSTIVGTFNNNENLNGSGAGGNNIADADGTQFTQTGRGHLVAGAGSIIASAENVSAPFEIHFIDNAGNDGQTVYIRALEGQTIRMRRAITKDTTTGNLDLDESFDIIENGIVFFQYQLASNVGGDFGGWVPQISDVTAGVGGTGGTFQFPILYPKENLGTQNGVINLSLTQQDGHYKQITLDGDASLTFSNLPPAINGFKFYLLTIQDGTGGHVYTDLPDSVLFEGSLLGQLQTGAGAQTLWQFSTADGGTNWHASVINPQGAGGSNQTPWLSDIDANTFNLFNLDVLRYANGLAPGADGVIGFNTYGSAVENDTKMKWSIPASTLGNPRFYEWQVDLAPIMALRRDTFGITGLDMLNAGSIDNTTGISFFHVLGALSAITPSGVELKYESGFGAGQGGFHGFRVGFQPNPQFEIREELIRANKNLDMLTNDILEIDRARFDSFGGFNSITDRDDRLISGGAEGLVLNVPKITPFAGGVQLYFENSAQTQSDKQYSFEIGQFRMFSNFVSDTLGILFSNGGAISDLNTHIQFDGGVNSNAIDPQTIKFGVKDSSFVTKDIFELTGTEDGPAGIGGGMKMFSDLNMQTQNIHNIDIAHFTPDVGTGFGGLANASYGIVADETESLQLGTVPAGVNRPLFLFHAPFNALATDDPRFAWGKNHKVFATLDEGDFHMYSNDVNLKSLIISDGGFQYGVAFQPVDNPNLDGESRLINNGGSLDVTFRSGGQLVNLTTLGSGATSFIGFNADDDLRMNTFNITGVDVLRFQVDGGVIGFGEYGISADPTDFSMNFSVPEGRGYFFQDNLEGIAFLDEQGLQLLANTGQPDPIMLAREFSTITHSQGTVGLGDGSFRLVGGDVIFGSGGGLVNLTTLGAGGGDNLGNHIATQNLDMNSVLQNSIINFTAMSSFLGHSHFWTPDGMVWNLASLSSDSYSWLGGGSTPMMTLTNSQLNVENKRITNVSNPTSNLDAVNLQTLNTGFVTTNTNQTTGLSGNKVWTGSHTFDSALTTINGSLNLGNSVSDLFNVTGRFLTPLIPFINGTALGGSGQRWDVLASDLSLQNGSIVNTISNSQFTDNNFSLMTAEAIQDAIIAGAGGGSFVTTNTTQINLSGSKTWTGSHTFDGALTTINGSINLGNSVSDLFSVNGRFLSDLIPFSDGINLGSTSQRWDLFGQNMSLASGSTVSNISNSSATNNSFSLLTASAIQSAISAGGGSFVTTNTTQTNLSGSKTWTGAHRFTSVVNFDGSVSLGNSASDILISNGRWFTPLIPNTDGVNLGSTSQRWDVFGQNLNLAFGTTVSNISTSSTQSSSSALMTASAIQSAILAGVGGGPTLSGNNNWTGFNSWTVPQTFQSTVSVQGTLNIFSTLNHDGSLMGFRGRTPIGAPNYTVGAGPTDRTLTVSPAPPNFELAEVLGTVIRDLIAVGIFQ